MKAMIVILLACLFLIGARPMPPPSGETIVTILPGETSWLYTVPVDWHTGMTPMVAGGQVDLVDRVPVPIPVTLNVQVKNDMLLIWAFIDEAQTESVNVRIWWRVVQ